MALIGRWSTAIFFFDRLSTVTTMLRMMLSGTSNFSSACAPGRAVRAAWKGVSLSFSAGTGVLSALLESGTGCWITGALATGAIAAGVLSVGGADAGGTAALGWCAYRYSAITPATTAAAAPQMMGLSEFRAIRPLPMNPRHG